MRASASLLALLLALGCAAACAATQPPAPQNLRPSGYVNDFAGVVDAASKERLEQLCADLDHKTGVQIAVVTVSSLQDEPIEDFANRLFNAWGVGHKDHKGALLLLALKERRSRLEVGYGLEPMVTDGYAGSVLREMRPSLRQQHYGQALYTGVYAVVSRIGEKSGVRLEESHPRPPARGLDPGGLFLQGGPIVFVAFFVLFFSIPILIVRLLAQWLGKQLRGGRNWRSMGSTWGGFPGGFSGFGGYESSGGGGFGGFGGGSSGGGGASSDW